MKKILVISLLLALVLALVMPTAAMASSPPATFAAQGVLSSIDPGNVKQLGNSGNWLVRNRTITGQFENGDFGNQSLSLKYDGVFDLATQAGNLVGALRTGNSTVMVVGQVAPLTILPSGAPMLNITGRWTGIDNLKASGSFQAYMVFVPTADGHVDSMLASGFAMTGQYNGKHKD
jgi:hypothetical protein